MPHAKKATDSELLAAYADLGSVWAVAKKVGMCGQSVHERLKKLNAVTAQADEFTPQHQALITEVYKQGFKTGDGVLSDLAKIIGKSKQNICRWARKQGLTNVNRKLTPALAAAQGARQSEHIKTNGHPKGALGMKHTAEAKARISAASINTSRLRTPEQESQRILKQLKTREANGTLVPPRNGTTWKAGWREIGAVRKFYRSRWEANYARYLQFLLERGEIAKWEHEPETFWFEKVMRGVRSYLPDFRVTRTNSTVYYVEVKGYMDSKSLTKLKRMAKYHPAVELELVDASAYKTLAKTVSGLVDGWE